MYQSLYVVVNVINLIYLSWILVKIQTSSTSSARTIAFRQLILATISIVTLDILWVLIDRKEGSAFYVLNNVVNTMYMMNTGFVSMSWCFFTLNNESLHLNKIKRYTVLFLLPVSALVTLCVLSPFYGFIFYIEKGTNAYHRGKYHFMQVFLASSYYFFATIRLIYIFAQEQNSFKRKRILTMIFFSIWPSIAQLVNIKYPLLPVEWSAATIAEVFVFVNLQFMQISTDDLTELNNRRWYEKYTSMLLNDSHTSSEVFLFVLDLNYFKKINDTYGHLEGDNALIAAAAIIKNSCAKRDAFVARYGGDEFVIVSRVGGKSKAEELKRLILDAFDEYNAKSPLPYKLSVSIGYAQNKYSGRYALHKLFSDADRAMYSEKQKVHQSVDEKLPRGISLEALRI